VKVSAVDGRARGADLESLARGGMLSLVGAAVSAVTGVGLVALVTRGFSKAEAGVFFAATSLFLLGTAVAKLGAETGLVYFISRLRVLDQRARIRRMIAVALTPVTVAAVLVGAALFWGAPWVADMAVDGPSGHFTNYLRTLACFLPLAALTDTLLAATRGFRTQRPSALIESIGRPLGQVALVALVVVAGSASWLGLAWTLPYLPAAVLAGVWLHNLLPSRAHASAGEPLHDHDGVRREFWRYTWPRTFAGVAQLALQRLDIVLVAALRGPADAAIYTAATRFLVVGQLGSRAISSAVQPQLGEQLAAVPAVRHVRHSADGAVRGGLRGRHRRDLGAHRRDAGRHRMRHGRHGAEHVRAYVVEPGEHPARAGRQRRRRSRADSAHRNPRRCHRMGRRDRLQ
jgi:O-antigen/teichoic acid export membrane protein